MERAQLADVLTVYFTLPAFIIGVIGLALAVAPSSPANLPKPPDVLKKNDPVSAKKDAPQEEHPFVKERRDKAIEWENDPLWKSKS